VPAICGNHCRASARHCSSVTGGPPAAIPAISAGATYRRTVFTSTPRLRATSTFGRPAYQCCKISVTSTMVNVLLAISALRPQADERHTQLEGPGAEPSAPAGAPREHADRRGRELPDRGSPPTREFRDRQHERTGPIDLARRERLKGPFRLAGQRERRQCRQTDHLGQDHGANLRGRGRDRPGIRSVPALVVVTGVGVGQVAAPVRRRASSGREWTPVLVKIDLRSSVTVCRDRKV
jgi:hypothetical protein